MKKFYVLVAVAWTCVWVRGGLTEVLVVPGNSDTKTVQLLSPFSAELDNTTTTGLSSFEKPQPSTAERLSRTSKTEEPLDHNDKYGQPSCSRPDSCAKTQCCSPPTPSPPRSQCCCKKCTPPPCPCKPKRKRKPKGVAAVVALHKTHKSCKKCSSKKVPPPPTC